MIAAKGGEYRKKEECDGSEGEESGLGGGVGRGGWVYPSSEHRAAGPPPPDRPRARPRAAVHLQYLGVKDTPARWPLPPLRAMKGTQFVSCYCIRGDLSQEALKKDEGRCGRPGLLARCHSEKRLIYTVSGRHILVANRPVTSVLTQTVRNFIMTGEKKNPLPLKSNARPNQIVR